MRVMVGRDYFKLRKERRLNWAHDVEFGTVIATFDDNGNYDNGHTAILVNRVGTDYINVIQQNVVDDTITVGKIYFNNSNGSYIENANNYYIVSE